MVVDGLADNNNLITDKKNANEPRAIATLNISSMHLFRMASDV